MTPLAHLIWPAYLVAAIAVFWLSAQGSRASAKRWEIYTLGLALMSLGAGRLLFAFEPGKLGQYEWIFSCAHLAMLTHVGLVLFNYHKRKAMR